MARISISDKLALSIAFVVCLVLAFCVFAGVMIMNQLFGWEEVDKGVWRRTGVTHYDMNGDGRVDWEVDTRRWPDAGLEKQDLDHDAYFDVVFERTFSGVAVNVSEIHEKARWH